MTTLIIVFNCSAGSLLVLVRPLFMLFDRFKRWQGEKEVFCYRICDRYYEIIETVGQMLFEAKRVTISNLLPLRQVNVLLRKFNREINAAQNIGSVNDIELRDVRKQFGDSAAERILKLDGLFELLDGEGKDADKWHLVCSGKVIELSHGIIAQWRALVAIMARRRFMRYKTLTRDLREKAAAL